MTTFDNYDEGNNNIQARIFLRLSPLFPSSLLESWKAQNNKKEKATNEVMKIEEQ